MAGQGLLCGGEQSVNVWWERGGKRFAERSKCESVSNILEGRNVGEKDESGSKMVKLWRLTKLAKQKGSYLTSSSEL